MKKMSTIVIEFALKLAVGGLVDKHMKLHYTFSIFEC